MKRTRRVHLSRASTPCSRLCLLKEIPSLILQFPHRPWFVEHFLTFSQGEKVLFDKSLFATSVMVENK